jgi:hypothetical protein
MKDISGMKDALGTIIARYTYDIKPESVLMETDIIIRFEVAMLDAQGKLDLPADKEGNTYRTLFKRFRLEWMKAMEMWSPLTGSWKDATNICTGLLDNLMRIAVKEELINISKDHFDMGEGLNPIGRFLRAVRGWFAMRRVNNTYKEP